MYYKMYKRFHSTNITDVDTTSDGLSEMRMQLENKIDQFKKKILY